MPRTADAGAAEPRARPALSRDRILAAAVGVADERGVGAVTMRAVASRLGVEAMSPKERAEAIQAHVPAEAYPHLHRMASHATLVGYDADADFEFGLEIILDGLERILDESRPG